MTSSGLNSVAPGRIPVSRQMVFRCRCGLNRTFRAEVAGPIFDRLVAAGVHDIALRSLINLHDRRVVD